MAAPFVYESCFPTSELGSSVSGWFEFKIVEGARNGEVFRVNVEPFLL